MANYQVIWHVSEALQTLLTKYMDDSGSFKVTLLPPDVTPNPSSDNRLNLYLYHISENVALKNQDFPGTDGSHGQPPLALVLYYLLTVYPGSETTDSGEKDAQELLGDAMSVFHDFPIVSRDLLNILGADLSLRDELERLKITLYPMNLEDLSKIWTALPKASFRRSVAYEVSAVQIQGQKGRQPRRVSLPVRTRRIFASQLRRPEVRSVYRKPVSGELIGDQRTRIGDILTIEGANFRANKTWVKFGPLEPILVWPPLTLQAGSDFNCVSDTKIEIKLPDHLYPLDANHPTQVQEISVTALEKWQPGPQTVQVLTELETEVTQGGLEIQGAFAKESRQFPSNQAVFMLVPSIKGIDPDNGGSLITLTLNGTRLYTPEYKTFILVGDVSTEVTSSAPVITSTQIQISLDLHRLEANQDYLVRVMVNGSQNIETDKIFRLNV